MVSAALLYSGYGIVVSFSDAVHAASAPVSLARKSGGARNCASCFGNLYRHSAAAHRAGRYARPPGERVATRRQAAGVDRAATRGHSRPARGSGKLFAILPTGARVGLQPE